MVSPSTRPAQASGTGQHDSSTPNGQEGPGSHPHHCSLTTNTRDLLWELPPGVSQAPSVPTCLSSTLRPRGYEPESWVPGANENTHPHVWAWGLCGTGVCCPLHERAAILVLVAAGLHQPWGLRLPPAPCWSAPTRRSGRHVRASSGRVAKWRTGSGLVSFVQSLITGRHLAAKDAGKKP